MNLSKKRIVKGVFNFKLLFILLFLATAGDVASAQTLEQRKRQESARSDKFTGGKIERAALVPGGDNIKITINVPAFQMTLWQNGKEVKTYWIGVGKADYPIFIGSLRASSVVWNPTWIPPDSDWVGNRKGVKAGEVIQPTDPRNPLGKMKIPLGYGYLIHEAQGVADLGALVSHGCIRVMKADLLELAEKIVAARSLPVTAKEITQAKGNLKTLTVEMDPPFPVHITYDTLVVEGGKLRVYPDVYDRLTSTTTLLRDELESSGVKTSHLSDETLEKILAQATGKKQFVVSVKDLEAGNALTAGFTMPVVVRAAEAKPAPTRKTVRQRRTSR
jgi:hypothetical protein